MEKRKYDSTIARMAGNILSGLAGEMVYVAGDVNQKAVVWAVAVARAIVAETERTEPFVGQTTTELRAGSGDGPRS